MGENSSHRHGDTGSEAPDDTFTIDSEIDSPSQLDEVIKEAVDAVESTVPEDSDGSISEGGGPASLGESQQTVDVERLRAESKALRDRLMRTLADFDNFRKRTEREKKSLQKMGIFEVAKDFLGVIDNLERALVSPGSVDDLKQGVTMILRQQVEAFRRHGIEKIEAVGKPFDPTLHEAVAREETDQVTVPTVTAELQGGYLLENRLLRPAMVHVAMPAKTSPENAEGKSSEEEGGSPDEAAEEFGEETIWETGKEVKSVAD